MKYIYRAGKKFTLLLLASLTLFACQQQQIDSVRPPTTVDIEFNFPNNRTAPPDRIKGPERAIVRPGDSINFTAEQGSGAMLLIVMGNESPFVGGEFVARITPGQGNALEIADIKDNTFKYIIVDVSGRPSANSRQPLDPYIIIRR